MEDNCVFPEGAFNLSNCAPAESCGKSTKETGGHRPSTSPEVSEDSLLRPCFGTKDYSRVPAES